MKYVLYIYILPKFNQNENKSWEKFAFLCKNLSVMINFYNELGFHINIIFYQIFVFFMIFTSVYK